MKVYYAHPLNIYNTKQEERDLETLAAIFGKDNIYNPNNEEIEQRYFKLFDMEVFFEEVRNCDVLAFRATPFGKITASVAAEIRVAAENNMIVIELPSYIDRVLSVEDTRTYLYEVGQR